MRPQHDRRQKPLWELETENIVAGVVFGDNWVTAGLIHVDRRHGGALFPIRWATANIATSPMHIPAMAKIREAVEMCWLELSVDDAPEYDGLFVCLPPWCSEGTELSAFRRIDRESRLPWNRTTKVTLADIRALHEAVAAAGGSRRFVVSDVLPRSYILDNGSRVDNPLDIITSRLQLSAFVVRSDAGAVRGILDILGESGLRVDGINSAFVSTASLLTREERDMGAAVIDLDRRTTCCTVYTDGAISSCALIGGGSDTMHERTADNLGITPADLRIALAEHRDFPLLDAEGEKPSAASAGHEVSPAMARLDVAAEEPARDLFTQILGHITAGASDRRVRKIVICGDDPLSLRALKQAALELWSAPCVHRRPENVHAADRFEAPGFARLMGLVREQVMRQQPMPFLDSYNETPVGALTRTVSLSARRACAWLVQRSRPAPARRETPPDRRSRILDRAFSPPTWLI